MNRPVIQLQEVRKTYRVGGQDIEALAGVSAEIDEGDFIAIIGPSGSGKSTLMHLIGCLDVPTNGKLLLDGMDISKAGNDRLSDLRNTKIGFVFQNFNLLSKLDVLENVELPLIYSGMGKKERRDRALEVIEAVGLGSRIKNRPSQLSGGQCQRVAIARALINRPKIILADEPTGALDSKTGAEIMELFHEVNRRGNTVAIVTHDAKVAAQTRRQIELQDGKIVRMTGRTNG